MSIQMVFDSVVALLSAAEREQIRRRLTTIAAASPIGRQVEANIALEARLPLNAAQAFVNALIAEPNDPDRLREKYGEICDLHVLAGPEIGGVRPTVLGRAVVIDGLCTRLVKHHGFRTVKQAEAWLKRQCNSTCPRCRRHSGI